VLILQDTGEGYRGGLRPYAARSVLYAIGASLVGLAHEMRKRYAGALPLLQECISGSEP